MRGIEVEGLTKDFRVYHRSFGSIKSQVVWSARSIFRKQAEARYENRRVLDNVSFTVSPGETVAIVGQNGSGKSTLLSILSRIYLPTAGEARIHGRLISLLELGVGFHPELTGNDNLNFSAAMLGLTKEDMKERYDSIVEFSGLDRNILDLPVRMYSSGMMVRLGFASAVHMDADVLLLDEGMAVGDIGFQEKCYNYLEQLRGQGTTILMVTHEMAIAKRMATRMIWLDRGRIAASGDPKSVCDEYEASFSHR